MKKGFTLIELLVVIAIIGILASVVLVSFPGATKKAKDARVISAISQSRTVMEYVCASEGCADFSLAHADMLSLAAEIKANDKGGVVATVVVSGENVCISAPVNSDAIGTYYCADRTGLAGYSATACAAGLCTAITSP